MGENIGLGRITLWVVGITIAVFAFVWAMILVNFGLRVATAGLFGRGEAQIEVQSASFRLQAYHGFFNDCASIQGLEGRIDELTDTLAKLTPGSRTYNYTLTSLTGVKGLRHEAIAKYNQDALTWTEGQFRDENLPYKLVDSDYPPEPGVVVPNGGKTICAVQ